MKLISSWYDGYHTHVSLMYEGDVYGQLTVKLDGDKREDGNLDELAQVAIYKTLFADKFQSENILKLENEMLQTQIAIAEMFETLAGGTI